MKNTTKLIKLAESLSHKYANPFSFNAEDIRPQVERAVKTALANASQQPTSGIMPFLKMIQQDEVNLSFNVNRTDSLMNKKITVTDLAVTNPNLQAKYEPLKQQVETYLTKNWEIFPYKVSGMNVEYNNFTIALKYSAAGESDLPIAQY